MQAIFNVMLRNILNMLAEGGVNIVPPENGMESAAEAYEQWLADPEGYVGDTALPEHIQKLNKGAKGNLNNTYTYQEWKEKEGEVSFNV